MKEAGYDKDSPAFRMHFVTPVPTLDGRSFVVPQEEISTVGFDALAAVFPSAMTRCKKCGCTIDEHRSKDGPPAVVLKWATGQ